MNTHRYKVENTDALMGVDAQGTFMPGGGLAVAGGDEIVPVGKRLLAGKFRYVIFTRDMHPQGHISLASSYQIKMERPLWEDVDPLWEVVEPMPEYTLITVEDLDRIVLADHALFTMEELRIYLVKVGEQCLWPDHGRPGTEEAEVHPELDTSNALVYQKGLDPLCDSYSAVKDNMGRYTGLVEYLEDWWNQRRVNRIFLWGLAFDYCVGWTAKGLRELGFEVVVVTDGVRSISDEGAANMREELEALGVEFCTSDEIEGLPQEA